MDDLDDLLDDIEIDETLALDTDITQLKSQVSGLSDDVLRKWAKFIAADEGATKTSKFIQSHIYRSWDDSKNPTKSLPAHKLLQDAVRHACTKSGFDDKRSTKVLAMANPMETESGKQLQDAYNKQILRDMKSAILTSPDYDAERFPSLAAHFTN